MKYKLIIKIIIGIIFVVGTVLIVRFFLKTENEKQVSLSNNSLFIVTSVTINGKNYDLSGFYVDNPDIRRETYNKFISEVNYQDYNDQVKIALIGLLLKEESAHNGDYMGGDLVGDVVSFKDPRSLDALIGVIDTGNMATNAIASFGSLAVDKVINKLYSKNSSSSVKFSCAVTLDKILNLNLINDASTINKINTAINSVPEYLDFKKSGKI